MDQPQPAPRLPNFFQADAEFMNEVFPRFGSLQLAVIRQWRSSTPQQLIRYMPARPRCWQRVDQPNNSNRVIEQSFFKIKPFYA